MQPLARTRPFESEPFKGVALVRYSSTAYAWRCYICRKRSKPARRPETLVAARDHRALHRPEPAKILQFRARDKTEA